MLGKHVELPDFAELSEEFYKASVEMCEDAAKMRSGNRLWGN